MLQIRINSNPKTASILICIIFSLFIGKAFGNSTDTSRINLITKTAYNEARINPAQSIKSAHEGLFSSKKLQYKKGIADSYLALGAAFLAQYNPNDSATYFYSRAMEYYTGLNDLTGMGRASYGLSYVYNLKAQPEQAKNFAQQSIDYFTKQDRQKELNAALGALIYLEKQEGNYENALTLSEKSIQISKQLKDTSQWADALNNRGNIFKDMFLFNQAIDAYFHAYELWEQKRDSTGLAIAFGSIANVYFFEEDYKKSLEYNYKKLPLVKANGNKWEQVKTLNNIALSFNQLNQPDSALYYSRLSLQQAKKLNYSTLLSDVYNKLAFTFNKINQPDSALYYNILAISMAKQNSKNKLSEYLTTQATALQKLDNTAKALQVALEAHSLAKQTKNTYAQREAALLLSEIYYRRNQRAQAYPYLTEYMKLNDSITNIEFIRKVTRLDIQHEYDKKHRETEYELELLEKSNELKTARLQKTRILLFTIFLLSMAGAIISFLALRNKNHRIEQMNLEIRNYLFQLEKLKTGSIKENPINELAKNYGLTERETEIMELIATGIGNEDIADKLFVSKNTIKFHIKNIFIKLDVRNRVQALQKMAG